MALGAVLILGVTLSFLWLTYYPKRYCLSITPGSPRTRRTKVAVSLAHELRGSPIRLRVIATVGSEEALEEVNNRELDLALVQGGLSPGGWTMSGR
jgi:TRAP-type uncharacterized transport system substrate-binding protein